MIVLFLFSATFGIASDSAEINSVSSTMLTFICSALMALSVTYMTWRYRNSRKKGNDLKIVNRPPVRRAAAYYRRKVINAKG